MDIRSAKLDKEDNVIPGLLCVKDRYTHEITRVQRETAFNLVDTGKYVLTTKRGWRRQTRK